MSLETEDIQNIGGLWPEYKIYERQKCFVGHSREAEWHDDILSACADVLPEFSLEPWYAADHFDPTKPLRDKVVELIANARYGIYDLSGWQDRSGKWHVPRNVFIELGMAIALNRPALLLRHTSNQALPLPTCLQGVGLLEFAGETTLKKALEERLPHWFDVPPDRDWLNRFCMLGNRVCGFREEHPRARQWGHQTLHCHISDGLDQDHASFQKADRDEVRGALEDVLSRYNDLAFEYLDELSVVDGYQFLLCSHCQSVRSTPFAVYRIVPHTPAEVFIAIGMSIALEMLFEYDIPKVLLVRQEQDLPSLLRGYEVVKAANSSEVKRKLKVFVPAVIQKVRETGWKPRPLPFVEVSVQTCIEPIPLSAEEVPSLVLINELLIEQLQQASLPASVEVAVDLEASANTSVRASPQQLRRVFDTIIDNAVKAMPDGGRLAISTRLTEQGVEIAFSDAGPGIPESMLPKLLREPIEKHEGGEGTGIGLLVARTILQTYGGEIHVASTGPTGTTMVVWLPAEEEAGEAIPQVYETLIEDLDLSVRTYNCLKRAGITKVGEILERLSKGDNEMLAIRNFGRKSLDELRDSLKAKGFIEDEIEQRPIDTSPEETLLAAILREEASRERRPLDTEEREGLREQIQDLLANLDPQQREVLELRFGLVDGKPRTLREVGQAFGVSGEWIRQIQVLALRKLRHPLRLRKLRHYLSSKDESALPLQSTTGMT